MSRHIKIFFVCFSIVILLGGCGKKGEEPVEKALKGQHLPPIIDMHMHPHRMRITIDGKLLPIPLTYNNPPRIDESTK